MKTLAATVAIVATLLMLLPAPAQARGAVDAALALGAFAVFSTLFLPFALLGAAVAPPAPVYAPPTPVYVNAPPAPVARPYSAAPAISREVVYPDGRYLLYGDGVTRPYRWVWVPNPPPPGSAPTAPAR